MPKAEQSLNELLHEIRRVEQSHEVLTEKKIRSIYKQLLKELNHFLADEYLKYSQNGILTVAMLQEKSHYAKFLEEIEANVNTLTPEITSTIRKTVEDTYTACYKGMTEAVLNAKDTKSALDFLKDLDVRPEVMKRAIENPISGLTLPDVLEKNRKEVVYDIKQQVNIGLMNGDRYDTTAKKVAERLDVSYGKATNIVRTETHRVTEGGFMDCAKDISESLEDSEFVYAAIWRNMNDERVRPQHRYRTKSGWRTSISKNGANHQKMEGKIIQVGEKFQLEPDVYAECPGNSGTARNDCRCRCFLEYDLMTKEEFAEKGGKLLDKSEGNVQYFRPVSYDATITKKRGNMNITLNHSNTTVNDIYVSTGCNLSRKQLHKIDTQATSALKKMGLSESKNIPKIYVVNHNEMQKNAIASYNAVTNVLTIDECFGGSFKQIAAIQKDGACPNNEISTIVHELFHWSDAQEYQAHYGKITYDNYSQYINHLNQKGKKVIDKLETKGYNVHMISNYANESLELNDYDEVYTEYRVKELLR